MALHVTRLIAQLILDNQMIEIWKLLSRYSEEEKKDIISQTIDRSSLLFIAITNNRISIVLYLLRDCEADPNSVGWLKDKKMTCLYLAVDLCHTRCIQLLLEYGADTEMADLYKGTPLYRACQFPDITIAKMLIEHGASVESKDYTGENCLMQSTSNFELFEYLLSKGADINCSCYAQSTVLLNALLECNEEVIYRLLEMKHLNVRIRNENEEDAFNIAVRCSPDDIVERIRRIGKYSTRETLRIYEMECCFFRIRKQEYQAMILWQRIMTLRVLPRKTPIFRNLFPVGEMEKTRKFFRADDSSALSYLETFRGSDRRFLLLAYVHAALNIRNKANILCALQFLVEYMAKLPDDDFFESSIQPKTLILRLFESCNSRDKLEMFNVYVSFIMEYARRYHAMSDKEKSDHAYKIECLFYDILLILNLICSMVPKQLEKYHDGIKLIIRAKFRALYGKSITQVATRIACSTTIIASLVECGTDLYEEDDNGKCLIHDVVEYRHNRKEEIIHYLIDAKKLNLDHIKTYDYCIPCYIKDNVLLHRRSLQSLQCRIVRLLCQTPSITNIPRHLNEIIGLHLPL